MMSSPPFCGLAVAVVVGVHDEVDLLVVLPGAFAVEHVRAVADRVLTERLDVLEGRLGQREERRVAEAEREVRLGLLELDREGQVVDDLEARELRVLVVAEALDRLEEVARELLVREERAVVPGVDEGVRR